MIGSEAIEGLGDEWQVYSLHDPRTQVIRYVGITRGPLAVRYAAHRQDWTTAKGQWFKELAALGLKPVMRRLAFFDGSQQEAETTEAYWMDLCEAKFGAQLFNLRRKRRPGEKVPAGYTGRKFKMPRRRR